MRRSLPAIVSTLLLLSACGSSDAMGVLNSNGKRIGEIRPQGEHTAIIVNTYGEERGRVRGNLVRDDQGKRIGSIVERDGHTVILDAEDNAVGTMEEGRACFGKGQETLGKVTGETETNAAAAACLIFFLQE